MNEGPGSGVRILNQPAPPAFKESVKCAEQNLYAQGMAVVGGLNLGGSIEPVYNAAGLVEIGIEKGTNQMQLPVTARKL